MWLRMSGGASKPKIKDVLEYLKQTASWTRTDGGSTSDISGVTITYDTATTMAGEYRNNGYTNFTSPILDVKGATKLISSFNYAATQNAMNVTFVLVNADTNVAFYVANRQSLTNKEVDISFVDNLIIKVTLGPSNLNYFSKVTMTVSKLMLE